MILLYRIPRSKLKEVKKILEANPYNEDSLARVGYKLREGKSLGLDTEDMYLYIKVEESKADGVRKKLMDVAEELKDEEYEKVKRLIEEEEENVAVGVGAIFG